MLGKFHPGTKLKCRKLLLLGGSIVINKQSILTKITLQEGCMLINLQICDQKLVES